MRAIAKFDLNRNLEYYRDLILGIVKMELKTRHFQKLLGPFWWLLDPVFYALLFFFLTTILFRYSSGPNHLLFILTMVITWRWFAKSMDSAPTMILAYQGILKQTNFPVMILPFVSAAVELMFFLFGFAVLLAVLLLSGIQFSWVIVFLPAILLVQLLFTLPLTIFLSAMGVFLRDLSQVIPLITGIWFYLSPGIYSIERIPERFRFLYYFNPFATFMPSYKAVLLDGQPPNLVGLLIWFGISCILLWIALKFFRRAQGRFFKLL